MNPPPLTSALSNTRVVLDAHGALLASASMQARQTAERYSRLRQQQFLAGRGAGARALLELTGASPNIPRCDSGAPLWPADIVGSLAHDSEHAIALVGWKKDWLSLGVDVEPDLTLGEDAADIVLSDIERATVGAHGDPLRYGRLVFGAKECVHKAIHPLRNAWLDFEEVSIGHDDPALDEGSWVPRALSESARRAFTDLHFVGRWQRHQGKLLSYLGVQAG